MRRFALAGVFLTAIALVVPAASAAAPKKKRPSGIVGTVVNSTCYGPCVEPQPASPPYTGPVTVEIRRAADGALVATRQPTDGHFRAKVKRGLYTVSALVSEVIPAPTPQSGEAVMPASPNCWQGESKQVQVFRHRFSPVELQVTNACIL
jgi:hypothetical protein